MPDPDFEKELDGYLAETPDVTDQRQNAKSPNSDFDTELDQILAPKTIEMPVQHIEGDAGPVSNVTPDVRLNDPDAALKKWGGQALSKPMSFVRGLGHGAMNLGDEIAAGARTMFDGTSDPSGYGREYAAGSRFEDERRNQQAAENQARKEGPDAFAAGESLTRLAPMAIPGGAAAQTVAGLGTLAGAAAGAGEGGLKERAGAVGEDAKKNWATYLAAATLPGVAKGAGSVKKFFNNTADDTRLLTFMDPGERAAYIAQHGHGEKGLASSRQMARDIEARGWHKKGGLLGKILPGSSEDLAMNASRGLEKTGAEIETLENQFAANPNIPGVDIDELVTGLENQSTKQRAFRSDTDLNGRSADYMDQSVADLTENLPYLEPKLPIEEAIATKKNFQGNAKWGELAAANETPAHNTIRKYAQHELGKGIDNSIQLAESTGHVDPGTAAQYRGARETYSLGKKVLDPAIRTMSRESGGQHTIQDALAATVSPSGYVARHAMKGGSFRSGLAGTERNLATGAGVTEAAARGATPLVRGLGQTDGQPPPTDAEANKSLKDQMNELARRPGNWWDSLVNK